MTQQDEQRTNEILVSNIGYLDTVGRLLPLVGTEPGQHVDDEGDEDENEEGVDVDVRGEGVEEGEEAGRGGAGRDVEDGDAKVKPGGGRWAMEWTRSLFVCSQL